MKVSALRHNTHTDREESETDELDSDEYETEVAPWPKGVVEPCPSPAQDPHVYLWETSSGKSRRLKVESIPVVPREESGYGGRKKELFADNPIGVPEMPEDISSDEEDFMAKTYPNYVRSSSRSGSPVSPCSAPGTVKQNLSASSSLSSYRLRSVSDASFGDGRPSARGFTYESSNNPYQYIARQQLASGYNKYNSESQYKYRPDNPPWHRSHGPRLSQDTNDEDNAIAESVAQQYLTAQVFADPSEEMSLKARGKRKQVDSVDSDKGVPSKRMSKLRLETDSHGRFITPSNSVVDRYGESNLSPVSPSDDRGGDRIYPKLQRRATTPSVHSPLNHEHGDSRKPRLSPSVTPKRIMIDSDSEDDREWDPTDDSVGVGVGSGTSVRGAAANKKRKVNRYPCPVPNCRETFTRRNDVRRHVKNAAVHRDQPEALAILGEVTGDASTRCKYCGTDLSRADARMRHERASACGKRTTQKMKESTTIRI
ncbi:hypothetical protein K435DRAFT_869034 [Dendrothele bispora CBS 962.96]|uniref:C2H2-type domain-containing protein n=1 Tax=Dendrothele bispora (strain CBS 962.96) TaxID=1314807 RepID=A0A4S8LA88_DENBC|nr:hypothetical protein K435DRAFT_869034 [Dendrothele bispora CBS 962.96]